MAGVTFTRSEVDTLQRLVGLREHEIKQAVDAGSYQPSAAAMELATLSTLARKVTEAVK